MFLVRLVRQLYARHMAPTEFTTQVLKCDPSSISFDPEGNAHIASNETMDALKIASHHLVNLKQAVVFPTETVYGLGALALDAEAASKIFSTKGRPPDNPLIVHVASYEMLRTLLPPDYVIPQVYQALMKHFWPGALTFLFPRNEDVVPTIITANQRTVAIRMPSHPVARALIAVANTPLAAPSANTSGKPSPTRAEHVLRDLDGKVSLILDGGACGVGLESTVVDGLHDDGNIRVLRPGGITVEDIKWALQKEMGDGDRVPKVLVHKRDYSDEAIESAPTTPGMKYRHYSPSVPLTLLSTRPNLHDARPPIKFSDFIESLKMSNPSSRPLKIGVLGPTDSKVWAHTLPSENIDWHPYALGPVSDPSVIAHRLFDGLLTLEREGVHLMLIEEIEEEREGLAIMNRVRKAVGESVWISLD
ncbi:DHBP synthase RibB-like alpha/beta domain-containing protein [Crassisporium funariophilum]|nr:DHBP synthase RibB-like alpha/beta domain-containing protein [Crassisporium funariophilum]